MRIYAYIRVSTEMQSYASQEFEIRKYCEKHNLNVNVWISESISGTIAVEKRVLGKTLEEMDKGDILICTELSRLGRNMLMIMGVLNICSSKGIAIHSIKDNFDLTDSINSKIIAFAFALAAEIERSLISQRTREALAAKKSEGVRLGRPPGASKKRAEFYQNYDLIVALFEDGKSVSTIADSLGIHRNTLSKYLKEANLNRNEKKL